MLLEAQGLIESKTASLLAKRRQISSRPKLAVIWIGQDEQTAKFIRSKSKMADRLNIDFELHQLSQALAAEVLELIERLNIDETIDGLILQLPLPANLPSSQLIQAIKPSRDVDNLLDQPGLLYPTAQGIVELLQFNHLDPSTLKTIILGNGQLVGRPLAKLFSQHLWPFRQIESAADQKVDEIKRADLLISATGQSQLISPAMVSPKMIVVDGSGLDVDVSLIEPLVKAVTPAKGAVGPLTVLNLFANLLTLAGQK